MKCVTSIKLDNAVVGRYLSLQDNEFVDCVVEDIKQFVNRSRKNKSVLVFPPVNNYRRFLIHKVSEDYSEELCTFSIGQGHGRRTVVCFKRHLIRDLNQVKVTDDILNATGLPQPVERPKIMGVDRHQLTGQAAGTPVRDSNVKRNKAVPTIGIYRPPALRRTEEQVTTTLRTTSPVAEVKEVKAEKTRPPRQRRPDIQVYVPRAKRLSIGDPDRSSTSTQSTNNSLYKAKGKSVQQNSLAEKSQRSKIISTHQGRTTPTFRIPSPVNSEEFSPSTNIESYNLNFSHSSELDTSDETHDKGVGRGIRGSASSSYEFLSGNSGRNTPTSFDCNKQLMNYSGNNNGNYENCFDISRNESLFEDAYNFPSSSEKDEKLVPDSDVTMLTSFSCSSSMDFSGNFFDVGVGRGIAQRSSKSSSTVSTPGNSGRNTPGNSGRNTPGNSGRNTPSSLVDNGGQMWDYFSEIKNATNNSFNRNNTCEMDVQNMHDSSETVDTSIQSEPIDDTSFSEDPIVKCCDNSGQFLDCSADENKIIGCDGKEHSAHSDTNVLCSTSDGKCSVDDKTEDKNILPNKERLGHKKDDDECRVQEVQNRKNRRIIRGNFVSDVLIISDPNPVPPPVTENKSEEATPASNGVITKRKKVRHKSESASSPKLQSPEKQKSPSSPATLTLNPDECTWDMMYDDNGECLDPKLMEELTSSVGSVAIEKPQSDYRSYQSRFELIMSGAADDEFSHVLEIYNFPPEFKTQDLYAVFSPYTKAGFEIKWVDDTHALGVFSSATVAADVLATDHPFVKTRPLQQATHDSRMKARRSAEFLQPYRARPETCPALARRLVTGALGVKLSTSREEREAERKILKEAREKKRLAARQRDEAWEGTIGAENKELS